MPYTPWKKKFAQGMEMIGSDLADFIRENSLENRCGYDHQMRLKKELLIRKMAKLDGTSTIITSRTDQTV